MDAIGRSFEIDTLQTAIVGLGPRGLSAAEELVKTCSAKGVPLQLTLFEPGHAAGAGPNYDPDQSDLLLLNTPDWAIDVEPASFGKNSISNLKTWLKNRSTATAHFHPRSQTGAYLCERFRGLLGAELNDVLITHQQCPVEKLEHVKNKWHAHTPTGRYGPFDNILLTLGQPETEQDAQIATWKKHAATCGGTVIAVYPGKQLLAHAKSWAGRSVGIRGMGLSTLDAVRLLTVGLGGVFENGKYIPSGREPAKIHPFSLTGHAPSPKPASPQADSMFSPLKTETRKFEKALAQTVLHKPDEAMNLLFDAIVPATKRILDEHNNPVSTEEVLQWLHQERAETGSQETRPVVEALKETIALANGDAQLTIDYTVGQLWRKWQPVLRGHHFPPECDKDTICAIESFDEGLKRISYGPPVETANELLTLILCGLVDIKTVDDPDILLKEDGWELLSEGKSAHITEIVDSVLPSPDLSTIREPLIVNLVENGFMVQLAKGLGAQTNASGELTDSNGNTQNGLALLGRLALGSMMATDSIHDCFSNSTRLWASQVVGNHLSRVS